ncbi:hypothetical protein [Indibacter alkaliphilus]|nr:hypothetical protein [Indibacter alkaliphilus]
MKKFIVLAIILSVLFSCKESEEPLVDTETLTIWLYGNNHCYLPGYEDPFHCYSEEKSLSEVEWQPLFGKIIGLEIQSKFIYRVEVTKPLEFDSADLPVYTFQKLLERKTNYFNSLSGMWVLEDVVDFEPKEIITGKSHLHMFSPFLMSLVGNFPCGSLSLRVAENMDEKTIEFYKISSTNISCNDSPDQKSLMDVLKDRYAAVKQYEQKDGKLLLKNDTGDILVKFFKTTQTHKKSRDKTGFY